MNLARKDILEILGFSSVVLSLVFVGYQLMLDRNIALADSYAFGIETRKQDTRTKMESEEYINMRVSIWEALGPPPWYETYLDEVINPPIDSKSEILMQYFSAQLDLLEMDSLYFRYNLGLLDESYWNGTMRVLEGQLRTNLFRRAVARSFTNPLQDLISEILEEIDRENET